MSITDGYSYNKHANYPKKYPRSYWDSVHLEYPVRKFPETGESSKTIGHQWRTQPEILQGRRIPIEEIRNYFNDYNITKQLTRSQTAEDYEFKLPGTKRFNKHTSCTQNEYITHQPRRIEDRVPQTSAHGTTEMRDRYITPLTPSRLITNKDQYNHPGIMALDLLPESRWHKEIEPLDTTHEGFEKYLDPYLTTSRLNHRPFTADQLSRTSNSKDIVTYYTFKDMPWTRTPKPVTEKRIPISKQKFVYDREKFKEGVREIRTHNKQQCVPGTFRTEVRDNYVPPTLQPASQIHNFEEEARSYYKKRLATLKANVPEEYHLVKQEYATENSVVGSMKPICKIMDQHVAKNKRLENGTDEII